MSLFVNMLICMSKIANSLQLPKLTFSILCFTDRTCSGIIYLFTFGIFGIGWLIDICLIPGMVEHENTKHCHETTTSVVVVQQPAQPVMYQQPPPGAPYQQPYGQPYPGQPYPGQPYPGQPYAPQQAYPGQDPNQPPMMYPPTAPPPQ
ncbi:TM2 domain containing protein [Heterostelium album PN500]|uniref:TM2 domain containing protein n=1 Tax=Heterostelium pallidum (strain ATCC 26659 / Pp 5 / PN500) TaxID=670386 RepID=D3BRV5_HETP5|nr:TM2 domain containing protein [Heterostelium album PN500]EFA76137.1 TM2 domain containing protein [Heterostelium album PN500]|eukprot:XP_020428271.1 TM2 domain containing protein [Heterostelium album PN500]